MKVEDISPVGRRVLVRKLPLKERTTSAGLVVPVQSGVSSYLGTVMAVSPDLREPIDIGAKVLCTVLSGDEVIINQESLWLVEEDDLLATLEDNSND